MNILLVDDHLVIRRGLSLLISQHYNDVVFFEASMGDEMVSIIQNYPIDLMILDINLPYTDTINILRRVMAEFPQLKVLIYSMQTDLLYGQLYLNAGVLGYVSKDSPESDLITAIHRALEGKTFVSEGLNQAIIETFANPQNNIHLFQNPLELLSPRELQLANLLCEGKKAIEISEIVNLAPNTISSHKRRIFNKLGINSLPKLIELLRLYQNVE